MCPRAGELLASLSFLSLLTGRGASEVWEAGSLQLWQGEPPWRVGSEPWKALCRRSLVYALPGAR